MSFKSLAVLTLGRLKRGVKKTLAVLTLGRIRTDDEALPQKAQKGGGFVQPGRMHIENKNLQNNNIAIVLADADLF